MAKSQDINYQKKFKFDSQQDEYEFQLKKKRNWWWLLLLLLPLLLLIRCERDMTITVVDDDTDEPIEGAQVNLRYTAHYLLKDWKFLPDEPVTRELVTDAEGEARFEKLPCSVYSYIFYCLSRAGVTASDPCHEPASIMPLVHYTWNAEIRLKKLLTDVTVTVVDDETSDPIPGAVITVTTGEVTDSVITDAAGRVKLEKVPHCGIIDVLKGSAFGYADTLRRNLPVSLLEDPDSAYLRLRPVKERFTFFVKDVETREPIPGATAVVTLDDPRSGYRGTHEYKTNVDGRGMGFYDEGFILSRLNIKASKVHYNDSTLQGDYTIGEFIKLPDSLRTVWLRPMPFTTEFQCIDSLSRKPIPGVENVITVTDPAGNTETYTEISNRNGKFPVHAKEGSRIHIDSRLPGEYKDKATDIPSYDGKEEIIEMMPDVIPLDVDMVMVIDNTGSMSGAIGMVKRNASNFYSDLNEECAKHKLYIDKFRLKVISYGDLSEKPFSVSPLYNIPDQTAAYKAFVSSIMAAGGGDEPEDGLQAVRDAMSTSWVSGPQLKRHVIVVYTDASTHSMSAGDFDALKSKWMSMDSESRRMILFAPATESWNTLGTWPQVSHETGSLSSVLAGTGYTNVLENICKSL